MEITIKGSAKEIAALALELQGRQGTIVNQLVMDTVHIATVMKNSAAGNTTCTCNNPVNIENASAKEGGELNAVSDP